MSFVCYRGAATAQTDLRALAAFYRLPIILRGVNTSVHYHGLHADSPLSRQIHLVQNDLFALSYFFFPPNLSSHASAERAMSGLWPFLIPQNMSCFYEIQPRKSFATYFCFVMFFLHTFLSLCHLGNDNRLFKKKKKGLPAASQKLLRKVSWCQTLMILMGLTVKEMAGDFVV